jgi:small subunit ribosomal protein S13
MARISGVDLPKEKRVEIALTYIYGIGRNVADEIIKATGVNPDTRVKDLTEADVGSALLHRHNVQGGGRPSPRSLDEHQAADGDRLYAGSGTQGLPARPNTKQMPYRKGPKRHGRQEEARSNRPLRRRSAGWRPALKRAGSRRVSQALKLR